MTGDQTRPAVDRGATVRHDVRHVFPWPAGRGRVWLASSAAALALIAGIVSTGIDARPTPHATPARFAVPLLSAEQQRADLKLAVSQLERFHPGLYLHQSRPEWLSHVARLRSRLSSPATTHEFYSRVIDLVRRIACGHTDVHLPGAQEDALLSGHIPPVDIVVDDRRLFIVGIRGESRSELPGAELLSINGEPSSLLLARLMKKVPIDGFGDDRKSRQFELQFPYLYAAHTQGADRQFRLTVRSGGEQRTVSMAGLSLDEYRTWRRRPVADGPFRYRTLPDRIGYLDIDAFTDAPGETYRDFYERVFRQIAHDRIGALILDLRDNGGGMDEGGSLLAAYLMPSSFPYYHRIEVTDAHSGTWGAPTPPTPGTVRIIRNHPSLGLIQPMPGGFHGPLIVLINSRTFSTASDLAQRLHRQKRGLFIGSETSGGYDVETSGADLTVTLPHSGLVLEIPQMLYRNDAEPRRPHGGVPPDHFVDPTVRDMLEGRDPVLDEALRRARARAGRALSPGTMSR